MSVHADDGAVVAAIAGELDLATGPAVKDYLRPFLDQHARVVYELDQVAFIDSAGLESLFEAVEKDESIVFRNPSRSVRQIIDLLEVSVSVEESALQTRPVGQIDRSRPES